ncbi:hypothetical protein INT44_004697 [Umbelopsis vinacea]|uniref:DNA 3'-5' helicase n=1 Tax=Umbelopsis vinacea TaxID=44442 RepID=A0A8H7U733_9FUNG|nr:hypothetical protein INT44_004697 [Umbelopsis vinacea]
MLEDVLNKMNSAQYQAATSDAKVLQILAGPGSGKTRVLTTRVAWLVKERNVDPDTILVVTFTNKAANEMRNRLQSNDLLGSDSTRLMMGTFHASCSSLLRRYGQKIGIRQNFTIADTAASGKILETVLKELPKELQIYGKPASYRTAISKAKCQALTCDMYDAEHSNDIKKQGSEKRKISIVYRAYQQELLKCNALDFDDLLMEGCNLLEKHPFIARSYRYILVDEYQDTNLVQYNLIKLLTQDNKGLTIVGDPDQSIYGFRNADISNFRKMQTDYDNVVVVNLEENYRSTTHILDAASMVIQHDKDRLPKSLFTNNCPGVPISWLTSMEADLEANAIVDEIVRLEKYSNGILNHDDFCILIRINSHSLPYETALNKAKIPYRMRGGLRFFDRAEVKDVLGYLRLTANPYDSEAFTRIVNVPKRGIGPVTVKRVRTLAEQKNLSMLEALAEVAKSGGGSDANRSLPQPTVVEMSRFLEMMSSFQALAASQTAVGIIVETVIKESNIERHLHNQYDKDGKEVFKTHWSNVEELLDFAQRFNTSSAGQDNNTSEATSSQTSTQPANESDDSDALVRFLDSTSLDLESANDEVEEGGLEWPCVFATGCEEGVIPFALCTTEKEIQEECLLCSRLLYVGMTRAEAFLYISEVNQRHNPWQQQWVECATSHFLADLPESLYQRKFPLLNASTREWLAHLLDRPLPEETSVLESEGEATYLKNDALEAQRYRSDEGEEYDVWDDYERNSSDRNRYRSYDRGYQSTSFNAPPRPQPQATVPSNKAAVYEGRKQSTFGANPYSLSKKSKGSKRQPGSQYNVLTGMTGSKLPLNAKHGSSSQTGSMSQSQNESPYDYPTMPHVKQEPPYPTKSESKPASLGGFTSAGSLPMDQPFKPTKGSKRKGIKWENQQAAATTGKKAKGKDIKKEDNASHDEEQQADSSSQSNKATGSAYDSVWSSFLQKESEKTKIQRLNAEVSEIVIDSLQRIPNERGELSREHAISVATASAGRRSMDLPQHDIDSRVGLELQKLVDQGVLSHHPSNADLYYIAN